MPAALLAGMACELGGGAAGLLESPVASWVRHSAPPGPLRCPVLPDLRAAGGLTVVLWLDLTSQPGPTTLISALTTASAALDEPAGDGGQIEKGFVVERLGGRGVRFTLTDGFHTTFTFPVLEESAMAEHYLAANTRNTMIAFLLDGGPRVASCVINSKGLFINIVTNT